MMHYKKEELTWKRRYACKDHSKEAMSNWSQKANEMTRMAVEKAWWDGMEWSNDELARVEEKEKEQRGRIKDLLDLAERQSAALEERKQRVAALETQLAAAEQAAQDAISTSSAQQMQQGFHSCLQLVVPPELRSGSDVVGQVQSLVQRVQQQEQELQLIRSQLEQQSASSQQHKDMQQKLDQQEQELARLRKKERDMSAALVRAEDKRRALIRQLEDAEAWRARCQRDDREHDPGLAGQQSIPPAVRTNVFLRLGSSEGPLPGAKPDRRLPSEVRLRSPAAASDRRRARSPSGCSAEKGDRRPSDKSAPPRKR